MTNQALSTVKIDGDYVRKQIKDLGIPPMVVMSMAGYKGTTVRNWHKMTEVGRVSPSVAAVLKKIGVSLEP